MPHNLPPRNRRPDESAKMCAGNLVPFPLLGWLTIGEDFSCLPFFNKVLLAIIPGEDISRVRTGTLNVSV